MEEVNRDRKLIREIQDLHRTVIGFYEAFLQSQSQGTCAGNNMVFHKVLIEAMKDRLSKGYAFEFKNKETHKHE